ncbi:MAG: T9SS type A sorting domain-containing protein, partial [Bacteroidetes bacterium]|nr:T9SS type A sorting domain-containing protein [Bacteroidota bacterium]
TGKQKETLDIDALSPGTYFIFLKTGRKTGVKKFIKRN